MSRLVCLFRPVYNQSRFRACAALFLALLSTAVHAQWVNYPPPGTPLTRDGKPNLSAPTPRAPDGKPDDF